MIDISKATKKEIHEFNKREWHGMDIEHYGRPIKWHEKNFIFKATKTGGIVGTIEGKHEPGVVYEKFI